LCRSTTQLGRFQERQTIDYCCGSPILVLVLDIHVYIRNDHLGSFIVISDSASFRFIFSKCQRDVYTGVETNGEDSRRQRSIMISILFTNAQQNGFASTNPPCPEICSSSSAQRRDGELLRRRSTRIETFGTTMNTARPASGYWHPRGECMDLPCRQTHFRALQSEWRGRCAE
jgi:hypothetical protein